MFNDTLAFNAEDLFCGMRKHLNNVISHTALGSGTIQEGVSLLQACSAYLNMPSMFRVRGIKKEKWEDNGWKQHTLRLYDV